MVPKPPSTVSSCRHSAAPSAPSGRGAEPELNNVAEGGCTQHCPRAAGVLGLMGGRLWEKRREPVSVRTQTTGSARPCVVWLETGSGHQGMGVMMSCVTLDESLILRNPAPSSVTW